MLRKIQRSFKFIANPNGLEFSFEDTVLHNKMETTIILGINDIYMLQTPYVHLKTCLLYTKDRLNVVLAGLFLANITLL